MRLDTGLSHVVEALAREGFVAVSVDVVSAQAAWAGEPDSGRGYSQLIDAHLGLLADLNRGVMHGLRIPGVKGRIDTGRVGLVGHSRGGGYVLSGAAAARPGLFAVVAVEPELSDTAAHTVPVLTIRGTCDEDTGPAAGQDWMKELAMSHSTRVAVDAVLAGGGHAMLNTNLDPALAAAAQACPGGAVADPAAARDQVGQLGAAFMAQALRKATHYTLPTVDGQITGRNLVENGPAATFRPAGGAGYTDPLAIRTTTSGNRLLPAVPKGLKINRTGDMGAVEGGPPT
ncbi:poly(ethylene terephthalate) hydrolase family protein [Streptomyces sp. BE303]|uniref:poly(ethylene terephthalate) hydrolase family protein n=1 Tax=Streptomyces sp. BE303 TaxID=3002528 RepID=UPI002E77486C|nr:dienelactone hydrolase family protein [Streptomyces sp. BE303]MED7947640.1 dienelactone hydrolase family protein [Streptomyces sp. BE303]